MYVSLPCNRCIYAVHQSQNEYMAPRKRSTAYNNGCMQAYVMHMGFCKPNRRLLDGPDMDTKPRRGLEPASAPETMLTNEMGR